ncbi:MAG: barstar family protein [Nitrospinae bacterium]|nr:barstar family protein [Nitrospinota bacterium]
MLFPENLMRVAWHCVHFVSSVDQAAVRAELEGSGFTLFEIDGSAIGTEADLFSTVAAELRFPNYFGNNWDALDECLRDMDWLPSKGYVLFVRDAEKLWRQASRIAGAFVEAWLFAAEGWGCDGVPFHLVFLW